ncbi:ABC transporter permease [Pelagicoccus sp. SDUM812003]|uniref:ABC transporter permease n=1 Tax=Pelagicoccus sp. SDUM812003 TaxID=3041267 RepID=UPI00280EAD65|nr:ABC transporter permease [Pelagicoccus sp. SDUM812003]MDQ8202741.1 ABC transporter permease [Pelagicoccus sp. SDUM812003]
MSFANDFIVGLRQIRKNPGSAILAVVAYAVGLGLVGLMLTLIFGVVRAHPKDIDFDTTQTLSWDESTKHLWKSGTQTPNLRYRDFRELHDQQDVFQHLASQRGQTFSIVVDDYAERFSGSFVSAEYFDALTLKPQLGRFFQEGDDLPGSEKKAVISDHLWRNQLEGRDSIVGDYLTVNGEPILIIGVAGKDVDFPSQNDIWVVESLDPLAMKRGEGDQLFVIGQLKPEYTPASALIELNTIAKRFEKAYPESNTGYVSFQMEPMSSVYLGKEMKRMFYLMFICSLLVLLIACTNVANLTLSRATHRVKELAIRSSLGGNRGRLVGQMIVEGFSLAIIGGLLGLVITIWSSKATWAWIAEAEEANAPEWMNMDVDLQVVGLLSLITLFASLVASIIPAIKASRANVNDILKDNSRGSTGLKIGLFSKLLALFQLCVSCGLLITTSTMVSTAQDTAVFKPPYDPSGMMSARFDLPETTGGDAGNAELLARIQARLENTQGLQGIGFTTSIDMLFNWNSRWEVQGMQQETADDFIRARHEIVSDNYFDLLGIPILYGRGFEFTDQGENAQNVCVINQPLAKRLWPDENPVGKQIRDVWQDDFPWLTIVGVVPDTKMAGPGPRDDEELGGVYRPMSSAPQDSVTVFAKSSGNPTAQANLIRAVLYDIDPSIALYRVKTVAQAVKDANFGPLFFRNMFGLFGIAALALASIGVYGVMDFSVRQRFQEFGIRQALGANSATIMKQVLRLGAAQIAIGIGLGALLGWALVSVISQALGGFNVAILNYVIPVLVTTAIAAIALFTPAREVISANLANCLREE